MRVNGRDGGAAKPNFWHKYPWSKFARETVFPRPGRITLFVVEALEPNCLVAAQATVLVYGPTLDGVELQVDLGPDDEEGQRLGHPCESREVEVAAIHDVDRPRFDGKMVEDVHIVHQALRERDEGRNRSAQIEQRVQLPTTGNRR